MFKNKIISLKKISTVKTMTEKFTNESTIMSIKRSRKEEIQMLIFDFLFLGGGGGGRGRGRGGI